MLFCVGDVRVYVSYCVYMRVGFILCGVLYCGECSVGMLFLRFYYSICADIHVCLFVVFAGVKPEPASPHTPLPSAAAASAAAACPPCDDGVLVCIYPGCDEVYEAGGGGRVHGTRGGTFLMKEGLKGCVSPPPCVHTVILGLLIDISPLT